MTRPMWVHLWVGDARRNDDLSTGTLCGRYGLMREDRYLSNGAVITVIEADVTCWSCRNLLAAGGAK